MCELRSFCKVCSNCFQVCSSCCRFFQVDTVFQVATVQEGMRKYGETGAGRCERFPDVTKAPPKYEI